MPKPSKWKAAHVKCQAAVDNVRNDLEVEFQKLDARIAQLLQHIRDTAYYVHAREHPITPPFDRCEEGVCITQREVLDSEGARP